MSRTLSGEGPHGTKGVLEAPWRGARRLVRWLLGKLTEILGGPARRHVVVLLACVLALDSADKATVGAIAVELEQAFGIGHTQIGLLVTVTSLIGAVGTLPFGLLADRVRRTAILIVAIGVWSTAMIASGISGSYLTLLLTRLALGAVAAAAGPVVASLTGDFFPARERGRIYGFILTGELIGAGFGFVIAGDVAAALTWRAAFFVLAIPGFALAAAIWKLLPEPARGGQSRLEPGARDILPVEQARGRPKPTDESEAAPARDEAVVRAVTDHDIQPAAELVLHEDPARGMSLWQAIVYVLRIRTNVVLIVASALGYFFFSGIRTFAIVFVRGHFGLSQSAASSLILPLGIGAVAGVLAGGRVADWLIGRGRVNARVLVPGVSFLVATVAFAPALISTVLAISVPLFVVGAAALAAPNPPLDAGRLDIMHSRLWGRAESVRTVFRTIGEGTAPLLFGFVSTQLGSAVARGAPSAIGGFSGGGGGGAGVQGLEYTFLLMLIPLAAGGLILLVKGRTTYPRDVATADASERATREKEAEAA